jgi:hypothetical protein
MCGIAAFFSGRKPISAQRLKNIMASLRHHQPDARGEWFSPNRRVALGHTRLSIIDLETGDQPITMRELISRILSIWVSRRWTSQRCHSSLGLLLRCREIDNTQALQLVGLNSKEK